jgi:hypothetical protein
LCFIASPCLSHGGLVSSFSSSIGSFYLSGSSKLIPEIQHPIPAAPLLPPNELELSLPPPSLISLLSLLQAVGGCDCIAQHARGHHHLSFARTSLGSPGLHGSPALRCTPLSTRQPLQLTVAAEPHAARHHYQPLATIPLDSASLHFTAHR